MALGGIRSAAAGTAVLAAALAGSVCAPAAGAANDAAPNHERSVRSTMLRPTFARSWLRYGQREAKPVGGRFVVVHYVRRGPDAPPLNDDDHNGVPDYVTAAVRAGDKAILRYGRLGFKAPLRDAAGPSGGI